MLLPDSQMIGDVNGDGNADAVVFFGAGGDWYVAPSLGNSFGGYYHWKSSHGNSDVRNPAASTWQALAKVYGDGKDAPVAFYQSGGVWKALPSDQYFKPNILNTWQAWNIKYRPLTLGQFRTYDTTETVVIDEHLRLISGAHIDFLLFDETNNIDVDEGYIKAGAQAVCRRIQTWNSHSVKRPLKYAVAIGGMQFDNNPETMEQEAGIVWDQFVNLCGSSNYFYVDGKPLLISYASYSQRRTWETWAEEKEEEGDKLNTNRFTVRWTQGRVPEDGTPPMTDYGLYFGWGYPEGALPNDDVMVVMPGWNNFFGQFVSRSYNGVEGDFYKLLGWQRVVALKPRIVVINSFNEYSEQTAVAPTDTSALDSPSEKWKSAQFYWNMTKKYNVKYKR